MTRPPYIDPFDDYEGYEQSLVFDVDEAHVEAMARGADCKHCPLYGCKQGPIPSTVVRNAKLTIVGESLGPNEVLQGQNFVGASGRVLEQGLYKGGLSREQCTVTNVLQCRPPIELETYFKQLKTEHDQAVSDFMEGKREARPEPLVLPDEACRPRLERDIAESNSKVTLAVGRFALKAMAEHFQLPFGKRKKGQGALALVKGLKDQHGAPVIVRGDGNATEFSDGSMPGDKILCSSYHPAFAMRPAGKPYMPVVVNDIARAAEIAIRGHINWYPPNTILFPSVETIERVCKSFVDAQPVISADLETNDKDPRKCQIRCVGIGGVVNGEEIVMIVPFRYRQTNETYWPNADDRARVCSALRSVFDTCQIVGHNIVNFDSTLLIRFGLLTNKRKRFFDTMIAAKNSDMCDLPKRLEFVSARYLETIAWKIGHDDKVDTTSGAGTDEELHAYCGADVANALRIWQQLEPRLHSLGSWKQFDIDMTLAPIFRDMGHLGLCIDPVRKRNLAIILRDELKLLKQEIRDILLDPKYHKSGVVPQAFVDFVRSGPPKKPKPIKYTKKGKPCKVTEKPSSGFNHNTPVHVGYFLYTLKGLIKPSGDDEDRNQISGSRKKSKKKREEKVSATGAGTLIKLVSNGVDTQTKDFIDCLFVLKAFEKLAGTYVGRIAEKDFKRKGMLVKAGEIYAGPPIDIEEWEYKGVKHTLHVLHTTYQMLIASGRVSTKPAVQNLIKRAREALCYECLGAGNSGASNRYCKKHDKIHCCICHEAPCSNCNGTAIEINIKTKESTGRPCRYCRGDGKTRSALNMHAMIIAPPGHVIVSADFDQLELRIYAAVSGDEDTLGVLGDGRDPHTWNYACLESDSTEKAWEYYRKFEAMGGKKNSKVAYLRTIAKQACVAEGELVLTNRGQIPIQKVLDTDLVWDGVEWVKHDGVIYKGEQEVIFHDQLWATRDHKVWLKSGQTVRFDEAAKSNRDLARSGKDRHPIRIMDDNLSRVARISRRKQYAAQGEGSLYLRNRRRRVLRQHSNREIDQVCFVRNHERTVGGWAHNSGLGQEQIYRSEESMYEFGRSSLERLRRSGNRIPVFFGGRCSSVDDRELWITRAITQYASGSNKQERPLRAGKSAVGRLTYKPNEQTNNCDIVGFRLSRRRMAIQQTARRKVIATRLDSRTNNRAGVASREDQKPNVAQNPRKARVYDILNAGPRRRFTVSGRLVSNCFAICYGCDPDKLFDILSRARDKATGEVTFPDITRDMCARWHKNWFKTHPWTKKWQETRKRFCEQYKFVQSLIHNRKRFFPGGYDNAALNGEIQSSGADIANDALIEIERRIPHRGWSPLSGLILQVHDEITAVVPEERAEEALQIFVEAMTTKINGVDITATAAYGKSWADV